MYIYICVSFIFISSFVSFESNKNILLSRRYISLLLWRKKKSFPHLSGCLSFVHIFIQLVVLWNNQPGREAFGLVRKGVGQNTILRAVETPYPIVNPIQFMHCNNICSPGNLTTPGAASITIQYRGGIYLSDIFWHCGKWRRT